MSKWPNKKKKGYKIGTHQGRSGSEEYEYTI